MPLSELPDEELAAQTQNGEVHAFAEIVSRYRPKLLRYGRRFLRTAEDAEDAVQDAFLNAYRNIASFRVNDPFSPWLYRIAHNSFISLIRRRKREPLPFFDPDSLFPHPVAPDQTDRAADRAMIRRQLDRGLATLDAKYREILVLRYDHNLSYNDIADVLRVPLGTVSIRIKRALAKLQSQFTDHD